ncbi:Hypothetical predicted protein [Lynx pardinus]|uniref:Uncharacterized protein n=1 Tax=Lynx pardinus TaxID=191816 RepID=A0A485PXH1_LYNPA|nr:Hypothetical predicted protein [Lynx pardinus]
MSGTLLFITIQLNPQENSCCVNLFLELFPELNVTKWNHLLSRKRFDSRCLAWTPNKLLPSSVDVSATFGQPLRISYPTVNPGQQGSSNSDLMAKESPLSLCLDKREQIPECDRDKVLGDQLISSAYQTELEMNFR